MISKVPFNDLSIFHREIAPRVLAEINSLVNDSDFIGGNRLEKFEKEFARFAGAKHCIGLSNGTDAIVLGLHALGIEAGDEVITTANTFIATLEAILLVGAKPVLVDCEEGSALIDLDKIEAAITPRTKALLPVHLYGIPVNLEHAQSICQKHRIALLQDAAQAHGALWAGLPLSSFPGAQTYSFFPGKNLGAWGDAGALITDNDDIADFVRSYRNHGRATGVKYSHERFGANYRMDPLQAVVLSIKLERLAEKSQERRRLYSLFREQLSGVGDLQFIEISLEATPVHHLCIIRTRRRKELQSFLTSRGISTGIHYPIPCHLQPSMIEMNWSKGQFPNAELLAEEILSLPFYPEMGEEAVSFTSNAIRSFF